MAALRAIEAYRVTVTSASLTMLAALVEAQRDLPPTSRRCGWWGHGGALMTERTASRSPPLPFPDAELCGMHGVAIEMAPMATIHRHQELAPDPGGPFDRWSVRPGRRRVAVHRPDGSGLTPASWARSWSGAQRDAGLLGR